ncbi:NfeD family protein [Thalassomonas sp. M1454]|uniref:NfeD family protein n=1 Tax=Thalassomonas sp. M1454 TaxID=2594477 RepID=UPI00117BE5B1|nr:NfeD family protein [Thalassomonas sp. M1454]TRX53179.1 NfeD family protein [Thalassomonas sp. M1454]
MEMSNDVLAWGSVGIFLMLAELILPGGIVVFLGTSALIVAVTLQLDVIDSWVHAFTLWFILSIVLLLAFRNVSQKLVGGDTIIENTDENLDVFGQEVEVIETIGPGNKKGRILFQGSNWSALGDGSEITKGDKAKIVCRDNISYVVEKVS